MVPNEMTIYNSVRAALDDAGATFDSVKLKEFALAVEAKWAKERRKDKKAYAKVTPELAKQLAQDFLAEKSI